MMDKNHNKEEKQEMQKTKQNKTKKAASFVAPSFPQV